VFAQPVPALAQRDASDLVAGVPLAAQKLAKSVAPDIEAKTGILVTGDGHVLWSRYPDAERPMASTTKMMSALVALKAGGLDREVTVSRTASRVEDGVGLVPGQHLTRRQLLGLMLVHSANDAAFALGEGVGGDMPTFVKMMNQQAVALGLRHTRYANPHGLDAKGHFTSAADLAALARVAMTYPEFRRIVSCRTVAVPSPGGHGQSVYGTTDLLLGNYRGLEGIKTGYTDKAGYCFVGSAKRGGVSLIAVVLGADDDHARFTQAARLLDWGFKHVSRRALTFAGESVGTVRLGGKTPLVMTARTVEATSASLLDLEGPVVRRVTGDTDVSAPVFKGQPVGQVAWMQGKRTIAKAPVVADTTISSVGEAVGAVPVTDFVDVTVRVDVGAATNVLDFDPNVEVRRQVVLDRIVSAPVSAGQRLGLITYMQGSRLVATVPIVAASSVAAPSLLQSATTWLTRELHGLLGGQQVAQLRINDGWTQ
jgi:serine-type D-Ala-D-Ala carboxypeptidase (penicillin-binding protein 5/6)